ncbi:MAG TPA: Rieske 2Fe-2S domain-containing protein [Candidatus Obscuribacterales bacterium]
MGDDTSTTYTAITYNFCELAELRKEKFITKWVDELKDEITAVYMNDKIHVVSSVCPHFGGDFAVDLKKGEMRCKWHDWTFCIDGGQCTNRNLKTKLRQYEFFEQNGSLIIRAS